jgi:hypothetical protein
MMEKCFSIYFILENKNLDDSMMILVKPWLSAAVQQTFYFIWGDKISTIDEISIKTIEAEIIQ